MTVFFDKINKSFLFVPKMSMNTVMTIDGQKTSEFVFDNTQAKKHIKFFYAPDAFTKEYLFTDEWEYPTPTGCKWTTDLKRGGVSVWNWVGDRNASPLQVSGPLASSWCGVLPLISEQVLLGESVRSIEELDVLLGLGVVKHKLGSLLTINCHDGVH